MFGQDFDVKVWSKDFEFWNLIKICVRTCFFGKQNSTLGSVVPLAMFHLVESQTCAVGGWGPMFWTKSPKIVFFDIFPYEFFIETAMDGLLLKLDFEIKPRIMIFMI